MANTSTEAGSTTQSDRLSSSASGSLALSQRSDSDSQDENNGPTMSEKWLKDFLKKDFKTYYRTPELNEKLYLHFKGKQFRRQISTFLSKIWILVREN